MHHTRRAFNARWRLLHDDKRARQACAGSAGRSLSSRARQVPSSQYYFFSSIPCTNDAQVPSTSTALGSPLSLRGTRGDHLARQADLLYLYATLLTFVKWLR